MILLVGEMVPAIGMKGVEIPAVLVVRIVHVDGFFQVVTGSDVVDESTLDQFPPMPHAGVRRQRIKVLLRTGHSDMVGIPDVEVFGRVRSRGFS
jgi:hypothetical protein